MLLLEAGYYKDAVSRAYYCMCNAARALLLTMDISPKTHKGLISKFGQEFMKMEKEARDYAGILSKAEDLREMADYGIYKEISRELAESTVDDERERFLKKIREVLRGWEITDNSCANPRKWHLCETASPLMPSYTEILKTLRRKRYGTDHRAQIPASGLLRCDRC